MSQMSVQVVISALDRFSPTLDRLERRLRDLDRVGGSFGPGGGIGPRVVPGGSFAPDGGGGRGGLSGAVAPLGLSAPLVGAGALGLGLREAVTAAADFESALTEIRKKGSFSAEQTSALGEEIKDLATNGSLAVPIEEIAAAYERGAAAGIPLDDLRNFAALSVKAADGFGMTAEEVGNFSAKLSKGLGLSEGEITRTFDLINSLSDAGIADESQVVDFIDRAGAPLKTLGLTTEQTAALGTTLLNIGMRTETAATGMGALASQMLTVGQLTGKGKRTFEKYMGPVGDFAALVDQDANGALLTMLDTLGSLGKAERMDFLTNFSGREWSDEMLRLVEASAEYRRNLAMAADEASWMGSLDAAYALKLDDFWSQWRIMRNALAELTIDVGTAGMPAFQAAVGLAKRTIEEIGAGFDQFALDIDMTELEEARTSVTNLITEIRKLLDMGGDDSSPIVRFFERLAAMANTVSGALNLGKDALQALGLVAQDGDTPEQTKARVDAIFQGIEDIDGGPIGSGINDLYQLGSQTPKEIEDRNRSGMADWRADYDAAGAAYPPSSDPAFDARVRAREARRAAEVIQLDEVVVPSASSLAPPPEVNLAPPPIDSVPLPTQRPDLDTSAYLLDVETMRQARAGVETPINTTADVNIGPAIAKLASLRAEASRTANFVQAQLASAGSGAGNAFEARRDDQWI